MHLLAYNWWDDFFITLKNRNESYRFMQIWVQADRACAPYVNPIGGNRSDYLEWKSGIAEFLRQTKRHRLDNITLELYLDELTFIYHQDDFRQFLKYPAFKCSFVEDFITPDNAYPLSMGFAQCVDGIPALCSDFLRISLLHDFHFDYNVYMDIDTFIYRLKYRKYPTLPNTVIMASSDHVFGLYAQPETISHSFSFLKRNDHDSSIETNNDCIVDYHGPEVLWSVIQALAEQRLSKVNGLFDLLLARPYINSYEEYQYYLNAKIQWALANPDSNVNQIPLVIETTGPGFWKDMDLRLLTQPYVVATIPSSGGWMNRVGAVYGHISKNEIDLYFPSQPEVAKLFIAINFMSHDYQYFRARNTPWIDELMDTLRSTWSALSHEQRNVGAFLFRSSFDWVEEEE